MYRCTGTLRSATMALNSRMRVRRSFSSSVVWVRSPVKTTKSRCRGSALTACTACRSVLAASGFGGPLKPQCLSGSLTKKKAPSAVAPLHGEFASAFESPRDFRAFQVSVSWGYNWWPAPAAGAVGVSSTMEFAPMVWGGSFDVTQLAATIPAGAKYLLGFNEPNFGSQSNLTPEAAAALWPRLQQLAALRGLKLVSPALNYCGGLCNETDPFGLLDKSLAACSGCQVGYIALHWYACSKDALVGYLGKYKAK